ncbi:hypothetical protein PsorP6_003755 [Peronosclerospora sorghi]|uniref:Uncharacterized protein n=1 Tax=Peronosclerospora sorghi TaxID=230839 RepID=A0ACC0VQP4_9STRA|nr:hypothetical protein PsorP6_003755 [Peronosclerospora sorghi]
MQRFFVGSGRFGRKQQVWILRNETGVHNALNKVRVIQHIRQEALVGFDNTHREFRQCTFQLARAVIAV